jgi:hypothetical protein
VSEAPPTPTLRGGDARARPIPVLYWPLWMGTLAAALVVFYAILTPVWMLIRAVAWVSERPLFRRT